MTEVSRRTELALRVENQRRKALPRRAFADPRVLAFECREDVHRPGEDRSRRTDFLAGARHVQGTLFARGLAEVALLHLACDCGQLRPTEGASPCTEAAADAFILVDCHDAVFDALADCRDG